MKMILSNNILVYILKSALYVVIAFQPVGLQRAVDADFLASKVCCVCKVASDVIVAIFLNISRCTERSANAQKAFGTLPHGKRGGFPTMLWSNSLFLKGILTVSHTQEGSVPRGNESPLCWFLGLH